MRYHYHLHYYLQYHHGRANVEGKSIYICYNSINLIYFLYTGDLEFVLPPLAVTTIDHATFDGWMEEARQEDHEKLIAARKKAMRNMVILKQEAKLRRMIDQTKRWIIDKFVSLSDNPYDVGIACQVSCVVFKYTYGGVTILMVV